MFDTSETEAILNAYDHQRHDIRIFMTGVVDYIGQHPKLTVSGREIVHSYKSRMKDREHLRTKIFRKESEGRNITPDNLFSEITDLAGVRILHLFQEDFREIDTVVRGRISEGDWILSEQPRAYTWDPENITFFRNFDLKVIEKATSYTSVHYLLRPRRDSRICCELQVRTLFEEIWGGSRSPN